MTRHLTIAVLVALTIAGCRNRDESFAKQAGSKVGEAVMDFGSGVGSAVDTKLTVPVEISQKVRELGLSKTVAKSLIDIKPSEKGFSAYFISKNHLSCVLIAKAFNKNGEEIGRCVTEVNFEHDDAKYVNFTFPAEMDSSLVAKYVIDVKEPQLT